MDNRYFLFYEEGTCKGKGASNLDRLINVWLHSEYAKEVSKEEYESTVPVTE